MAIVILLTLRAREGDFGTLKDAMRATLPDTAAREGCLGVWACADPETESLLVYERWRDRAAQQSYMAWRAGRGDIERLSGLLREPAHFETREDVFG